MTLDDTYFPFRIVEFGGQRIRLNALSFRAIGRLFEDHAEPIARAVGLVQTATVAGEPLQAHVAQIRTLHLIEPVIVAAVAAAAGRPDDVEWFAALPAAIQIQCAKEVWELTAGSDAATQLRTLLNTHIPVFEITGTTH